MADLTPEEQLQDPLFAAAIGWHTAGLLASPNAGSVRMCQAVFTELNTAVALVQSMQLGAAPQEDVDAFLTRHARAPYGA